MIIFLHGPDTYRSKQRLQALRQAFQDKYDKDGQSIVRLHGAELSVEQFRQAVHTVGLFSQRRCVIIEELLGQGKAAIQDGILQALEADIVPKDFVVIFWEADLPITKGKTARGESALHTYLLKQKTETFPLLDIAHLHGWITQYVQSAQAKIAPAAVQQLIDRIGSDLWRMQSELEKLIAMAGEEAISVELTKQIAQQSAEVKIFAFSDALAARNPSRAIIELQRLLHDGMHPLALVQMIARQLQTLLLVDEAAQDTQNSATIAKRLGIHPFVAKKSLEQVRRFTRAELLTLHECLVELDHKLKSSRVDPTVLVEEYILGFSTKR